MATSIVFICLGTVFLIGLLLGGIAESNEEFTWGSGRYRPVTLACLLVGLMFSSDAFWGEVELAFREGMLHGLTSNAACLFLQLLLAYFVIPGLFRQRPVYTSGDIAAAVYGDVARAAVGVCSVLMGLGYILIQLNKMWVVCDDFLDISPLYCVAFLLIGVFSYLFIGGWRAIMATRILYVGLSILSGLVLVGGLVYACFGMGHDPDFVLYKQGSFIGNGKWSSFFVRFFFFFSLPLVDPGTFQCLLSAGNAKKARKMLVHGALLGFTVWNIPVIIGTLLAVLNPGASPSSTLHQFIFRGLPDWAVGLVVTGMISIVISTTDVFLHVIGLVFTRDLVRSVVDRPLSPHQYFYIPRIACLFFVLFIFLVFWRLPLLLSLLTDVYSFWIPIVGVSMTAAIAGIRLHYLCFYSSATAGMLTYFAWKYIFQGTNNEDVLLPAFLISAVVFFGTDKFLRPFLDLGSFHTDKPK